jgi:hypothetical protein
VRLGGPLAASRDALGVVDPELVKAGDILRGEVMFEIATATQ